MAQITWCAATSDPHPKIRKLEVDGEQSGEDAVLEDGRCAVNAFGEQRVLPSQQDAESFVQVEYRRRNP